MLGVNMWMQQLTGYNPDMATNAYTRNSYDMATTFKFLGESSGDCDACEAAQTRQRDAEKRAKAAADAAKAKADADAEAGAA